MKYTERTKGSDIQTKIQELLGKEITSFALKGKGACNTAYQVETTEGRAYIVKEEREDKETYEQNDLVVEARVIQRLSSLSLSVPLPRVAFISEDPKLYGYEYIEGEMMIKVWPDLSEDERVNLCRQIGRFHAEIGKKFTKEMTEETGAKIDMSTDFHPEITADYDRLLLDDNVPENFKALAKESKAVFETTENQVIFQFIHNDAHHENILIQGKEISGVIDFGDAEYGEVTKEFSRYIRDYPDYFRHMVSSYEEESGNKLSYERLVSHSMVADLADLAEDWAKGGEDRAKAERAADTYRKLLAELA